MGLDELIVLKPWMEPERPKKEDSEPIRVEQSGLLDKKWWEDKIYL